MSNDAPADVNAGETALPVEFPQSLSEDERPGAGLRRIISLHIDFIVNEIAAGETLEKTVHSIRKKFKTLRSMLRMLKTSIPKQQFDIFNIWYRDLARDISSLRDTHVLIETLDLIRNSPEVKVHHSNAAAKQRDIISTEAALMEKHILGEKVLESISSQLLKHKTKAARISPLSLSQKTIASDVFVLYKTGFLLMQDAFKIGDSHHLHEWRKFVKHLQYARQILGKTWPQKIDIAEDDIKELAEILGTEHDLSILIDRTMEMWISKDIPSDDARIIIDYSRRFRSKMRLLSREKGRNIYRYSPQSFRRRFNHYHSG